MEINGCHHGFDIVAVVTGQYWDREWFPWPKLFQIRNIIRHFRLYSHITHFTVFFRYANKVQPTWIWHCCHGYRLILASWMNSSTQMPKSPQITGIPRHFSPHMIFNIPLYASNMQIRCSHLGFDSVIWLCDSALDMNSLTQITSEN